MAETSSKSAKGGSALPIVAAVIAALVGGALLLGQSASTTKTKGSAPTAALSVTQFYYTP